MIRLAYDLALGAAAAVVIIGLGYLLGHLWPEWGGLLGLGLGTVVVWQGVRR